MAARKDRKGKRAIKESRAYPDKLLSKDRKEHLLLLLDWSKESFRCTQVGQRITKFKGRKGGLTCQ